LGGGRGSSGRNDCQQEVEPPQAVVLMMSWAEVVDQWWQEGCVAVLVGGVAGVQRLIPVLLVNVPLPESIAAETTAGSLGRYDE